jgi:hypothetical protein
VIWSLGNEEREQGNERGARIVGAMKRLAKRLDGTRPVTVAMNGGYGGKGVSNVVDVQGFNYNEPAIDKFHQEFPNKPLLGSETASTVSTRGIYENDKAKGYVRAYDTEKPPWAATAEVLVEVLRRAPVSGGRLRLDRLRLPRRADALWVAVHQLALRHPGHVRLSQGQLLLLPGMVGFEARAAPVPALELERQRGPGKSRSGATPTWSRSSCF